ncbi:MAG: hypothetical protein WD402_05640 [Chloroflexota bacterium]
MTRVKRVTRERAVILLRHAAIYAAIILALAANVIGLATIVIDHERAFDWDIYVEAARRFPLGTLYEWDHPYFYRYAPQFAPILGLLTWVGLPAWRVAHFLALAVLPSRRLALLLLVSYPFWFDVNTGNLMVFVLLAAAWAYRGNGVATAAYLALCVLVPRPIMLPLLVWILWQRPAWRLPFIAIAAVGLLTALPTGYLPEWIGSLFRSGADEIANDFNLSPSRFIGAAWLIVGLPLSAWLIIRGRIGWASMAISPYLLPYWVQMLGLELVQPRDRSAAPPPGGIPGTR